MISALSHLMIYVHDVARAARWYGEHLGFEVRFLAGEHYGSLHHPGLKFRLDLHPCTDHPQDVGHGALVYFCATDLDATVAALRSRGVKVSDPRSESGSPRFCSFQDSEGNHIGLSEPEKQA